MLTSLAKDIAELYDFSAYLERFNSPELKRDMLQADFPLDSKEWLSFSFSLSAFLSAITFLLSYYFTINLGFSFSIFPLSAISYFFVFLKLPAYYKRKRAEELERELSLALRTIVIQLKLKTPFEHMLQLVADGGYGNLSKEFGKITNSIKNGASVHEALQQFSTRTDSLVVNRMISLLIFSYEHGLHSEGLSRLADELIVLQKTKSRQFASKMAIFGLLFIAISCIIPALFAAYIIIGSSFLSISITPEEILLYYSVLFPSLSLAVLLYIKEKSPALLV